jgi:cytochrome oxidase assembly protein ShyY1
MLRVLVTPRWIALTAVALTAATACVLLGRWQWFRAIDTMAADRASLAAVIPLAEAAPEGRPLPASSIGRRVTAVGILDVDRSVLVTDRVGPASAAGEWVLSPLVLPDGRVVAVVRGWVADAQSPAVRAAVPVPVDVAGVLQPFETFYAEAPVQPDGTLLAVNERVIRQVWGSTALVPGMLILATQSPASSPVPVPVPPTIGPPAAGLPLSNFFYAIQWWLFGAFALAMWARWWRLDARKVASQS